MVRLLHLSRRRHARHALAPRGRPLGHELILDSRAYTEFCERAFGYYLHHTPGPAMTTPMPAALDATTRGWERSGMADVGGAVLWGLDAMLGATNSVGEAVAGGDGGHHHHGSDAEFSGSFEGVEAGAVESGGGDPDGGGDSGGGGCGGGE